MSRLTRDGTAEPVSRDQILRHARGQGNIHFPCSADHEQDWRPYPVDPYSAICDDHTYIHTYIHVVESPYGSVTVVKRKFISLNQLQYFNVFFCVLDYKPLLYKGRWQYYYLSYFNYVL